ncbi:MAG: DUF4932 domain-containing protein, partial [Phycisphaerae bacterium]
MTISSLQVRRAFFCIRLLSIVCSGHCPAKELEARVDPRVELMSIVFRLAGNPEYNPANSKSGYSEEVESYFGTFRDHPVIQKARELRSTRGVSYDAVMSLAVHLTDAKNPDELTPFHPRPDRLDERWQTHEARDFLKLLRDFVRESRFAEFAAKHEAFYARCAARMEKKLSERDYVEFFNRYFGARPTAEFHVILGMLNGGGNYGVGVSFPDGREIISPIIGISSFDSDGLPVFGDDFVPLIIHEFCHSYTNQVVDENADALQEAGERLHALVAEEMASQAYGTWKTVMYESFVRAVVVRAMAAFEGTAAAEKQIVYEESRGFLWTREFGALLTHYEKSRDQYKSFDEFLPEVIAFLRDAAPRYDQKDAEVEKNRPHVVSISPANGDNSVDPAIDTLVITFDRPMTHGRYSLCGDGDSFPQFVSPPRNNEN